MSQLITDEWKAVERRVSIAKSWLLLHRPWWGEVNMYLKSLVCGDEVIKRAGTDGTHVYYNYKFVSDLTDAHLRFVMAHEILHVALRHTSRRGLISRLVGGDKERWNMSADYVINLILHENGFDLSVPGGVLYDERFKGMSTEKVYTILEKEEKDHKRPNSYFNGHGVDDEDKSFDDHSQFNKKPSTEVPEEEWSRRLQSATTKHAGKITGSLEKFIKEILDPEIDWRLFIVANAQALIQSDYAWVPPNRRYIWQGLYLPQAYMGDGLEVDVAFDVSLSVGDKNLSEFIGGLRDMLSSFSWWKLRLMNFDTVVKKDIEVEMDGDLSVIQEIYGRGGTSFQPVFDHIYRAGRQPKLLVIFTDGYARWPTESYNINTLWVMTPDATEEEPPFGTMVRINNVLRRSIAVS
jgi:predicted metal-dependent peptidase